MLNDHVIFGDRLPLWAEVDDTWYCRQSSRLPEEMYAKGFASAADYHEAVGAAEGFSPNPYFDEKWYRSTYADVRTDIEKGLFASGFEHYCCVGFRTRSPHWLFSEERYRWTHAGFSGEWLAERGYPNGYAHFLDNSASACLTGSPFYDPELAEAVFAARSNMSTSQLRPYLAYLDQTYSPADEPRLSWLFDPQWYLTTYPQVLAEIEAGRYASALHHYLTNDTPDQFNPLAVFDEADYQSAYPDIASALQGKAFRNAYEHFIRYGAYEGRRPRPDIDLTPWVERLNDLVPMADREVDHPFRQWLKEEGRPAGMRYSEAEIDERSTRALFLAEASRTAHLALKHRLDFSCPGEPEVSVIIVVHNQIALTLQTLSSLRANFKGMMEVILVDSASGDLSQDIEDVVSGLRIMRYNHNIGFLLGANEALAQARAPFCLYLNNDIRLYPNAVSNALRRLDSADDIGAVGAKIVRSHMRLQEAGSIIWRDGATYGYRRQDDPAIGEVNFVRDVDYCSAAFLMVRTSDARQLGGFDQKFVPAYFEDTDFCLRMIEMGKRVVYDPAVAIEHMESGSFGPVDSHDWIQINHKMFMMQHRQALRDRPPPHVRNAVLGREQKRGRQNVLFIEDRIPLRRLGSGYVRSNEVTRMMSALGYQVSVFPMMDVPCDPADLCQDFPDDVELLHGWHFARFAHFVEERTGYYDMVWICRTHNLARLLPLLVEHGRHLPPDRIILDTEVIDAPRRLEKARLLNLKPPKETCAELVAEELSSAHFCQQIVAVSETEAELVKALGYEHVPVLGHALTTDPTPRTFDQRRGFLFVGALHAKDSPNYDSLQWLLKEVAPLMSDLMEEPPCFTIVGHIDPSLDLSEWMELPNVRCMGAVDDLRPLYDSHRVFVAPTRYAGGLPYKLHEAASQGLPAVATEILAQEVGWTHDMALLSASAEDPADFARKLVDLYTSSNIWHTVRLEALAAVTHDCDPGAFKAQLSQILTRSREISRI